jgi:hypothetical protein
LEAPLQERRRDERAGERRAPRQGDVGDQPVCAPRETEDEPGRGRDRDEVRQPATHACALREIDAERPEDQRHEEKDERGTDEEHHERLLAGERAIANAVDDVERGLEGAEEAE